MKKSIFDNIQLNKEKLERLSRPLPDSFRKSRVAKKKPTIHKKLEIQPWVQESLKLEIFNLDCDKTKIITDSKNLNRDQASTSKELNLTESTSGNDSHIYEIIPQEEDSEHLEHFSIKNTKSKEDISANYSTPDVMVYNYFNYPVERIEFCNKKQSDDEAKSSLNVSFSECSFSDTRSTDSQNECDKCKEELNQKKAEQKLKQKGILHKPKKSCNDVEQKLKQKGILHKPKKSCNDVEQKPKQKGILHKPKKSCSDVEPKPEKVPQKKNDCRWKLKLRKSLAKKAVHFPFEKARNLVFCPKKDRKTCKHLDANKYQSWEEEKGEKGTNKKYIPIYVKSDVTPEEDLEIKRQILDFFIFILNLILITIISLCMVSSLMFYFTNITTSMFFDTYNIPPIDNSSTNETTAPNSSPYVRSTLRDSFTIEHFWAFAESTLLQMLYWSFYYPRIDPITASEDDKKMLYENQILGVARMRQVRVRSDSCEIHPDVKRFFDSCYYYYSVFSEETKPIKEGMEGTSTATAWVYTEAKKLGTSFHRGKVSIYGGGGYYLDLAVEKEEAENMIKELKENNWVSKATRAVFIDFNIYNANVNLFCLCKIILEFPPVGGIIPVADFYTLKIIRYLNTLDFFILGCEFLYLLFIFYYTWQAIRTMIRQKLSYFLFFWNYVDLIILILSYIYVVLSIVRYIFVQRLISTLNDRYDKYTEFNLVKDLQLSYNNTIAVLLFFSWIKLFKYLNFNVILLEFRATLARSLKDILGFFPIFFTMFLAFTFLAYLLFGHQVKSYFSLWLSFLTLLQAFLGEFYYSDIVESNPILGPIFYVAYIFFIFFVLLNVFIAIINDAYASVKSQIISDSRTNEYLKRGLLNIFTCGSTNFSKKLRIREAKKRLLFQEIQSRLKKAGFSETEIKLFFYKYDINFSNFMEGETKKKVVQDLELKRIDFSETSEQFQISSLRRRLDNLTSRIKNLENHLQPVIDKVDTLVEKNNS